MKGTLIKISRVQGKNSLFEPGFSMTGTYEIDPKIGWSFRFVADDPEIGAINTSTVKAIAVNGVLEMDKLVLPSEIPHPETLDIPDHLGEGDIVFATKNSVYLLTS